MRDPPKQTRGIDGTGNPMSETNQNDGPGEDGSQALYHYRLCVYDEDGRPISETSFDRHSFDSGEENALSRDPPFHEDGSSLELIEESNGRVPTYAIDWVRRCESQAAESDGDHPAAESRKQCPDCKGTGSIVLLVTRAPCKLCDGAGFVRG